MEFLDIYFVILDKKWIYYELLKINDQKIPKINTSEEIFKLNDQMKSKSCNFYVNGKLRRNPTRPKLSNSDLSIEIN